MPESISKGNNMQKQFHIHRSYLSGVCTALLLAGCGSSEPPPERETMKVEDTVFAPQIQSLDKARAVEDTLEQSQQRTDAALADSQ